MWSRKTAVTKRTDIGVRPRPICNVNTSWHEIVGPISCITKIQGKTKALWIEFDVQQLTNLTKMISLSLGHLFMSLNSRMKRWPSDKLIIFVRFVNCCTWNSIYKAFSYLVIQLIGPTISSQDVLALHIGLGHTPILVLLVAAAFLATLLFYTQGVFVYRISYILLYKL